MRFRFHADRRTLDSRRVGTDELTALDLFAGAGGATQGLRDAGFRVLAGIDNDEVALRTYRANHTSSQALAIDLSVEPAKRLMRRLDVSPGDLTLLKACPPCQGYSSLGSGDSSDPRNDLVRDTARFLEAMKPRAYIVENVPRLRSDRRFSEFVALASSMGYAHRDYIIDAIDFGVPQRRRRLIAIGVLAPVVDFPATLPELLAENFDCVADDAAKVIQAAGDIASTQDSAHRARTSSHVVKQRIEAIPVNGTRFDIPKAAQLACHKRLGSRSATASYGRVKLTGPAPTMTTRCTTPACGQFIHPTEHRGLSLREAALLQTFPPDYRFRGSYGEIEKQIGNAVPVRLAEGLGLVVRALIGL